MREMTLIQKDVKVVKALTCNKCGLPFPEAHLDQHGILTDVYGVSVEYAGGFNSEFFQDGDTVEFDVCEKCLYAYTKTFAITPKMGSYMGDDVEDTGEKPNPNPIDNAAELKLQEILAKREKMFVGLLERCHRLQVVLLAAERALMNPLPEEIEPALKLVSGEISHYGRDDSETVQERLMSLANAEGAQSPVSDDRKDVEVAKAQP